MDTKKFNFPGRTCLNHLHGKRKIQYIWDYYKLPIVICLIFLYIISYTVHGHFSKKEIILYTDLVNVSASEQLTNELSHGFLNFLDANASKTALKLYTGLYLTDNREGFTEAEEEALLRAGRIIKEGGLVAFPTETVYGLGGDALNPGSSRKIYAAKEIGRAHV